MRMKLLPLLDLNSDEWHTDETVVKIGGVKHYIWFIVDSETRFVIGFHLSPHRDNPQAFSLLSEAASYGKPAAVVSDRYSAYKVPVKSVLGVKHIRVESFKDDISNNLIATFMFFFNFVRPHSALNGLTPAQVAGLILTKKQM